MGTNYRRLAINAGKAYNVFFRPKDQTTQEPETPPIIPTEEPAKEVSVAFGSPQFDAVIEAARREQQRKSDAIIVKSEKIGEPAWEENVDLSSYYDSFGKAYAAARKKGLKTFSYKKNGKVGSYSTESAEEKAARINANKPVEESPEEPQTKEEYVVKEPVEAVVEEPAPVRVIKPVVKTYPASSSYPDRVKDPEMEDPITDTGEPIVGAKYMRVDADGTKHYRLVSDLVEDEPGAWLYDEYYTIGSVKKPAGNGVLLPEYRNLDPYEESWGDRGRALAALLGLDRKYAYKK